MNISSTTPQAAKPALSSSPKQAPAAAEQQVADQDSVEFTLELPKNIDLDLVKLTKYAGRVAPGMASLALNSPTVLFSPVLNAISPATSNSKQHTYEYWTNIVGGAVIAAGVGGLLGAASGNSLGLGFAGAIVGGIGGGIRTAVAGKAKYPEIGEAAHEAKWGQSNKAFATGVALRKGYAAGIREAYMDGGQYADNAIDFARGLVGLKSD